MNNMLCIGAFLIILGVLVSIRYLFPVKEDPDIVDDIFGDMEVADEIDVPLDIVNVPGHRFLYYSPSTRYVYGVYFTESAKIFDMYTSNNRFCKYLNGRIMEVIDNKVIAAVYTPSLPR